MGPVWREEGWETGVPAALQGPIDFQRLKRLTDSVAEAHEAQAYTLAIGRVGVLCDELEHVVTGALYRACAESQEFTRALLKVELDLRRFCHTNSWEEWGEEDVDTLAEYDNAILRLGLIMNQAHEEVKGGAPRLKRQFGIRSHVRGRPY